MTFFWTYYLYKSAPEWEKGVHESVDGEEGDDTRAKLDVVREDGEGERIHSLLLFSSGARIRR